MPERTKKTARRQVYRVRWEIDIEATSHRKAAREAFASMQDPDTLANSFEVQKLPNGEWRPVDLAHDQE